MAKLISFAGLPGVGKTTIARLLSRLTGCVYLRIDEIEAALRRDDPGRDVGPDGYYAAAALAASNLELGHDVIVDCVNPWAITRQMFADAAERGAATGVIGVEIVCSDPAAHRGRVENRAGDVPGLVLPDWQKVVTREYAPWDGADLRIDTAHTTPEDAVRLIRAAL